MTVSSFDYIVHELGFETEEVAFGVGGEVGVHYVVAAVKLLNFIVPLRENVQ